MNRYQFWLLTLVPFLLLVLFISSSGNPDLTISVILMAIYLPVILNIRRRHVGISVKQVLVSFIPFYGFKERCRLHFS